VPRAHGLARPVEVGHPMNHWDRLQGQLRGETPDCLPIALWRHWPEHDQDARAAAMATMAWQRRYDFDLVRCMPSNTCMAEVLGARAHYRPNLHGLRAIEQFAVTAPDHWPQLHPAGPRHAALTQANDSLKQVAEALGGTVPLVQTVASPLTTAWQLAGDAIFDHMTTAPDLLDAGLNFVAALTADFARRAIESGACGIALVMAYPGAQRMSDEQLRRFVHTRDIELLAAIRDVAQLNMVCLGDDVPVDTAASYPVEFLNWQAGRDFPTAAAAFPGIVAGGLDPAGSLACGSRADVDRDVTAAIMRVGGRRAMIAAGGPCRLDTPEANIDGAVDAVRRRAPRPPQENKP